MITTKSLKILPALSGRLERAVKSLTSLSNSQVNGLIDHGCITVNGAAAQRGHMLEPGDVLEARFDTHRRYNPRPQPWCDDAFEIIFEDEHLIVVNKSAGVLTVPTPGASAPNTLIHALARYLQLRSHRARAHVVHRLDRDVSGLLVFGKTHAAAEALQSQFEDRKPEREYAAIVHGIVPARGTFQSHLATGKSLQRHSTERPDEGELAITHFELIKTVRGASWVKVHLETGRRNQIRVHFAEAGHPVLGDERYRPDLAHHPRWRPKRLALHAVSLSFTHPVTGKPLRLQSALPAAMRAFLGQASAQTAGPAPRAGSRSDKKPLP